MTLTQSLLEVIILKKKAQRDWLRNYGYDLGYDSASTDRMLRYLSSRKGKYKIMPVFGLGNYITHYVAKTK